MLPDEKESLQETPAYIEISLGVSEWQTLDGRFILEEDFKVGGEVWRVHKNDPDPFPSRPHAHCVGGKDRFIGLKLHLGTGQMYDGTKPLGRKLAETQFLRLIELIKPKFPDIKLPLTD